MIGTIAQNEAVAEEDIEEIILGVSEILQSHEAHRDELIPILQEVQQRFGYLPEQSMKQVANFTNIPESTVFGVATFYAFFKLVPTGKNTIQVCRGTACHVRGGARILREVEKRLGISPGESTPDLEYYLETVACIGACALAPTMRINDMTYGQMTPKKVAETFEREEEEE